MIHEYLSTGRENARTGRQLSKIFDCDIRDITAHIEQERREGVPICAASGENPGYYLAENAEELESYCKRLKGRADQLYKTRKALIKTLGKIRDQKKEETGNTLQE